MKAFFRQKLKEIKISSKHKLLLAVSGGVDSMVLMDLFDAADASYAVAHCNFSLRGEESDLDELFVTQITNSKKIQFFNKRFRTSQYAKKNNMSVQMAARKLRYDWFYELKRTFNFDFIVTAHNKDDSAETVLINLIRGTGLLGLHGIKEFQSSVIRPMLSFSKKEIYLYAKNNQIEYREDSSNSENKYVRNKVRNEIMPIMQEINPNVIDSISSTITRICDVENIYKEFVKKKKKELVLKVNNEYRLSINNLLNQISPKQLLYEILLDFGFHDVDAVFQALRSKSGKEFFNDRFYMIKDRSELIISKHIPMENAIVYENTTELDVPFKISFCKSQIEKFDFHNLSNQDMYIDYAKLEFPLLIRPWQKGDKFVPLGMRGVKKISDYFIDNKFSLIAKKKARVLVSNNKVVCIIGERIDDRFKLVENSKKVYIVQL